MRPLHIAVDARELAAKPTGVGRYLRGLFEAWAADPRARRHEWTLYAHDTVDTPLGTVRHLRGAGGVAWEQRVLATALRRDAPDVLFAPAYTAPILMSTPSVVTVHDLSYFAHREWFRRREGARRRWLTSVVARRSRLVLTDSQFSRQEIVKWLLMTEDRIRVVYPGVTARPRSDTRDPLVLFVGSIFNRRHVPELIRAFARLAGRHPDLRLEIVGDDRSYPPEPLSRVVSEEHIADRVALRSYVEETTLDTLYTSAAAFAFLSEYEGFGLTPLEALTAGVVPVLLDTAIAREICGDAALYVNSTDPDEVATGLERAIFDERQRARVLKAAPAVLARYRWDSAASATLDALESAAS